MKKGTKIFLAFLIIISLAIGGLSIAYRQQLREQAELMAKQQLHRFLSITRKLQDLHETLCGIIFDGDGDPDAVVVGGTPEETENSTNHATEDVTEAPTEPVTPIPDKETETEPITEAETVPSSDAEAEDVTETDTEELLTSSDTEISAVTEPLGGYTVRAHEGIIGVFDAEGALVESVNVSVITLPEADRQALDEGIIAVNMEEVREILDKLA